MSWLAGLEERARAVLPAHVFDYVATGSGGNATRDEAADAWRAVRLAPHVLRDVTSVSLATTLLGHEYAVPWGVAPTSAQREVHAGGEPAMLRATAAAGALTVVSSNAGTRFADLPDGPWWLQVYVPADRTLAEPLLHAAVEAGASALVLTVDTPVVARKPTESSFWELADPQWLRVNFDEGYDDRPGAEKATDLGPHDLGWLAGVSGLPVVAKGVLRPDDARRCVDAGAAAVWVSNHGGRQLDRALPTALALPAVVDAVDGATQVYVDGGIRSGLDVVAALALGADAAFLGRPPVWALAEGEAAVARLHAELAVEVTEALTLAGCRTPADVRGIAAFPATP
ncbi:alpha-hydroxy-acid oxidizing protein [Nocardioides anomalus]|uniref:Alpha-hydroxy-acid oxidizing protein n=1 Tax=Nocardioides anomalus TaxID=2712223 RepID=A0A6G6WC43_9ACTN|nr:alpha-hydroxy acid oxidase [Nocardioides anomalus]QIG42776.1 alpha-hydroxy-acid oxidizing protein [Nocardioides anomalus]